MSETNRVNHAVETTVRPLPGGLYLLKGVRDEWMQEKSQHCDALDTINNLRQRVEILLQENVTLLSRLKIAEAPAKSRPRKRGKR